MKTLPFITICVTLLLGSLLHAQSPDLYLPGRLTIQSYIDGPSELHVKKDSIYWINGKNAKPGRLDGANYRTYVNGEGWLPIWHLQHQDRGVDTSFSYSVSLDSIDFDLKLISVGERKEDTGIVPRTPITTRHEGDEFIVTIPDPEPGAMWYKFVLTPK